MRDRLQVCALTLSSLFALRLSIRRAGLRFTLLQTDLLSVHDVINKYLIEELHFSPMRFMGSSNDSS